MVKGLNIFQADAGRVRRLDRSNWRGSRSNLLCTWPSEPISRFIWSSSKFGTRLRSADPPARCAGIWAGRRPLRPAAGSAQGRGGQAAAGGEQDRGRCFGAHAGQQ